MKLYLFIIGFISLLGQVAILRELNVVFYGIELIYILAIGFWLVGTAAGAYTGRKKFIPSEKHIDFLFIIFGLVLIIDVLFIRSISFLMGGTTGTYLSFGKQLSGMFISIMPVSFLLGLMFQWSAKKFVVNGKNLAFAYAVESAGGFAGGFASTYLMKFGFSNLLLILICSAVSVLIILFYRRKQLSKIKLYGIIIYTVIMLLLMLNSKNIDHRMTKWQYPGLLAVKDTPYSRVAITSAKGQITVFENGALAYESESVSAETFVHLPMLQRDSMRHVLVLGGGVEGVIKEIAKYDLSSVDYVELNKDLLQLLKSNFPNKDVFNFNYDKLKIIYTDPREFLKKSEALQKYDLILVGMPQPMSAGSSRFYTMEFFRQCKNRLTANGIMAFRLQTAENIWSPQQELKISGIYNALNAVFEKIVVLPGTTNLLIASSKYLDKNGESIVERFKSQNISARLISSPYINYLYTNDRFF
ncbi:MAG: hypothetical protein KAR38_04240, partial [Calditrichia bacterium]|nr:hypothetical protein [Calditrichia bacterium]